MHYLYISLLVRALLKKPDDCSIIQSKALLRS